MLITDIQHVKLDLVVVFALVVADLQIIQQLLLASKEEEFRCSMSMVTSCSQVSGLTLILYLPKSGWYEMSSIICSFD
ncbi:hypothetical protein AKJ16_DCAP21532 [Drosera capensis]